MLWLFEEFEPIDFLPELHSTFQQRLALQHPVMQKGFQMEQGYWLAFHYSLLKPTQAWMRVGYEAWTVFDQEAKEKVNTNIYIYIYISLKFIIK